MRVLGCIVTPVLAAKSLSDASTVDTHCATHAGELGDCTECEDGYDLFGTNRCFYKCNTDLTLEVVSGSKKGLVLDDTTLQWCPDSVPFHLPNTNEPVQSIRMPTAWRKNWNGASGVSKEEGWDHIARYLQTSGAKVLIETQVTCSKEDDDRDWEDVMKMMQVFGPEHVMGLAVGSEVELAFQRDYTDDSGVDHWYECMTKLWTEHYFLDVFHSRIQDMDSLGQVYGSIPVTSIFGGAILAGQPFLNIAPVPKPQDGSHYSPMVGLVLDFLNNVTFSFGPRWTWTLNSYGYFDPNIKLDDDGVHCDDALAIHSCFKSASGSSNDCEFSRLVASMRDRMAVENFNAAGARDGRLWIGETGWSFPRSDTLSSVAASCPDFSSEETFQTFYKDFLRWDMDMPSDYEGQGPDHIFFYSVRDTSTFGREDHFGLIGGDFIDQCSSTACKLQERSSKIV